MLFSGRQVLEVKHAQKSVEAIHTGKIIQGDLAKLAAIIARLDLGGGQMTYVQLAKDMRRHKTNVIPAVCRLKSARLIRVKVGGGWKPNHYTVPGAVTKQATKIVRALRRRRIAQGDVAVLLAILVRRDQRGISEVRQTTLANDIGVTPETVSYAVRRLTTAKLLRVKRRGGLPMNRYTVLA